MPVSRTEVQSSSPIDNSWAGGLLRGLQNLVPTKASRSNIIGPCFKISTPSFSGFVHEQSECIGNANCILAFLTVQRYQATTRCSQLSNSFVFIFSISCNALYLERNISLSAVRSLADKRFPLVMHTGKN